MSAAISADWFHVDDPDYAEDKPCNVYNIIPDGDIVIVLTRPISCDDFISWPEPRKADVLVTSQDAPTLEEWLELVVPGTSAADCETEDESPDDKPKNNSQHSLIGKSEYASQSKTLLTDTDLRESPTLMDKSVAESTISSSHTWSTVEAGPPTQEEMRRIPQGPFQYRVSSQLLMAASPVLKDMLNNGEGLGKLRHADGIIFFAARGVNEKALRILLKILSHRSGGLPPKLELSCLMMLSVLASHLKCVDAVQYFGEQWCEKAEQKYSVPHEVGQIAMMWLCISFVFGREHRFKEAAQVFLRFSKIDLLPTLGLPVEDVMGESHPLFHDNPLTKLLVTIYAKRCETLKNAVVYLFVFKDKYSDLEYVCKFDKKHSDICGSVMEGCISRGMRKLGLVNRDAQMNTFDGWSIESLCAEVVGFQVPKWKTHDKRTHKCDFTELRQGFVQFLDVKIELEDVVGELDME